MPFCSRCGMQALASSKFCGSCGQQLAPSSSEPALRAPLATGQSYGTSPPPPYQPQVPYQQQVPRNTYYQQPAPTTVIVEQPAPRTEIIYTNGDCRFSCG